MGKDWIEYQCNSGETLFVYNKETGEHKWPHELGMGIEYRIMHGRPVEYREFSTTATQTDGNCCMNGCMSMYINRHLSHISNMSNTGSWQQQAAISAEKACLDSEPRLVSAVKVEIQDEQEENQCQSETMIDKQDKLFGNDINSPDEDNSRNTLSSIHNQSLGQRLYNISDMLKNLEGMKSSPKENINMLRYTSFGEGSDDTVFGDGYNDNLDNDDNDGNDEGADDNFGRLDDACSDNNNKVDDDSYDSYNIGNNDENIINYRNAVSSDDVDEASVGVSREGYHVYPYPVDNEPTQQRVIYNCMNASRVVSHPDLDLSPNAVTVNNMTVTPQIEFKSSNEVHVFMNEGSQDSTTIAGHQRYECPFCDKTFKLKSYLRKHIASSIHTGQKNFECNFCHKKFSRKDTLVLHIRFHTGEKLLECSYCGKKFVKKWNLTKHLEKHFKRNTFPCMLCGENFFLKESLDEHFKTHIGQKPFENSVIKHGNMGIIDSMSSNEN